MKKYKQDIKLIIDMILWDWKKLFIFEFLYKLFAGVILLPLAQDVLNQSMNDAGMAYLNMENMQAWLFRPYSIIVIILLIIIMSLYVFYEMSVFIHYFAAFQRQESISLKTLLFTSFFDCLPVLKVKNWLLIIIVLLLFPLTSFSLTPTTLEALSIPEYFIDFLKEQGMQFYIAYGILLVLINLFVFYMIYVLPLFLLDKKSFKEAFLSSIHKMKKSFFKNLFHYAICMLCMMAIFMLIFGVILFVIVMITLLQNRSVTAMNDFIFNYIILKQYYLFLYGIFMLISGIALIMLQYQKDMPTQKQIKKKHSIKELGIGLVALVVMIIALGFYFDYRGNVYETYKIMQKDVEVAAHRCGTIFAPENTIPALEYAIESEATYAEIDVQQSKDGVLYILHDTNFKRTTGVNKNIWEVDSSEIDTYDAGLYYGNEFANTKVPRLEDMILKADGKIKLMIELKKNGHENNLVEDTISLIQKYHFETQSVIASMDLSILKQAKQLEPSIQTVYIAPFVYGEFYDIEYVDIYSVESTFINKDMLHFIHANHKQVFAWTINKDNNIKDMLAMGIDGIVSDNPDLAEYYNQLNGEDALLEFILNGLFKDIR